VRVAINFRNIQLRYFVLSLLLLDISGCDRKGKSPATNSIARTISVVAWNIESGKSNSDVIASQLTNLSGYDIYCLSEVNSKDFEKYQEALLDGFVSVTSKTGRGIRLQILFNSSRFALLQEKELHEHGDIKLNNGTHRSPLFVRLKDRLADVEFIVMTNHFARSNSKLREQQAIGLREWARDQNVPIINIGDFNMDYDFHTSQGNSAFPEIIRDNVWSWVQPQELIDTNWYDPDGDGKDNFPDSMLDFAFVAGAAKHWNPVCRVIVRDGDFPDDKTTSDHRPIELIVEIVKK
jgi:endonuclease/exonuclease/phosphatase family metal-dependent hydrolase